MAAQARLICDDDGDRTKPCVCRIQTSQSDFFDCQFRELGRAQASLQVRGGRGCETGHDALQCLTKLLPKPAGMREKPFPGGTRCIDRFQQPTRQRVVQPR